MGMTKFSRRLRRAMEDQGATIRSIAAKSGLRDVEIWEYLQERASPKAEQTRKIARALGVSEVALRHIRPPRKIIHPEGPGLGAPRESLIERSSDPHGRGTRHFPVRAATSPLERTARRQEALLRLLIYRGFFTAAEWQLKVSEVSSRSAGSDRV